MHLATLTLTRHSVYQFVTFCARLCVYLSKELQFWLRCCFFTIVLNFFVLNFATTGTFTNSKTFL